MNISKKSYFFYELHVYNLPLAFILTFLGNVYIFKYKGWCQRYLQTNKYLSINDFKSIDQWISLKQLAYEKVQQHFNEIKNNSPSYRLDEKQISLENLYIQQFSRDYEFYLFFVNLINNHQEPKYLINYPFRYYLEQKHNNLLEEKISSLDFIPLLLDKTYQHVEFLGKIIRTIALFFKKSLDVQVRNYQYLCSGISPNEYPEQQGELNFSWLVQNKILAGQDILYLLDTPPSQKSASYLKETQINFITKKEFLASLPFSKKFKIFTLQFFFWGTHSLQMNYKNYFLVRSAFSSINWIDIFKITKPSHFIYSLSEGWPEPAESSLANSLNIKTIIWFYSAGEFLFAEHKNDYNDSAIRFSINEAKEIWVWHNILKDLIVERMFNKKSSEVIVIGPTLNGNLAYLDKPKETGHTFTIAFFDITPMSARYRLNYGEGPYTTKEIEEGFYKGVLKIYEKFTDINLIIKTKRAPNPLIYDKTESLQILKNIKSDRIIFPHPNQDPYKVINDADLIISVPFSSPTMLGLTLAKPSVYYNPLKNTTYSFKNVFKNITISDEEDLVSFIEENMSAKESKKNINNDFFVAEDLTKHIKESIAQRLK